MMSDFFRDGLEVEWGALSGWSETLQAIVQGGHLDVFTSYAETAGVVATHALILYQGYLKGNPLPNGSAVQRPSGNLARHASLDEPSFLDFRLENPESYAEAIEKGTRERDLKEMLATAPKARRAKDGSLYLIIPMRHGTQENSVGLKPMPQTVYAMAKSLQRSSVTGHRMEMSATGFMVQRNTYNWGNKLTQKALQESGHSFKDQNRFQGMYKFGNVGHSSYMTFRVLSSKSTGWVLPARPGLFPARTASEEAYQDGKEHLGLALLDDLLRLSGL
jgi:hypothetical protein